MFLYRDTSTGRRSLVVVNGDAASAAGTDGAAPMVFESVDGYRWPVQDGPPDSVPYSTSEGPFRGPETAL